ncbi:unnamed protein product [Caenorhabditis auriculariae]|uniref:BZIP domain-containing protein n=1 Tax=Caenorhabditis auriculariae TaxID=2777116 RepID=A0A8S1HJD6_9PELO|nr:unnamed protein product [Caenorhabditis auriculariae]
MKICGTCSSESESVWMNEGWDRLGSWRRGPCATEMAGRGQVRRDGGIVELSKRREQNKKAAARYRDKQKSRWQKLLDSRQFEQARNLKLKKLVADLEKQTAAMREKLLGELHRASSNEKKN